MCSRLFGGIANGDPEYTRKQGQNKIPVELVQTKPVSETSPEIKCLIPKLLAVYQI
jgi:hypothetical protein